MGFYAGRAGGAAQLLANFGVVETLEAVQQQHLALGGGEALVSFERDARIERFDADRPDRPTPVPLPIPKRELRANGGLETIAVCPRPDDAGMVALALSRACRQE